MYAPYRGTPWNLLRNRAFLRFFAELPEKQIIHDLIHLPAPVCIRLEASLVGVGTSVQIPAILQFRSRYN